MEENLTVEELDELLLAARGKLIEAWQDLDPSDPDYKDKAAALAALYKEVNADIKNKADAKNKASENQIEEDRLEEDKRANRKKEKLDIWGKIIIVGTTVFTGVSQIWMFKRSTRKEMDESILTTTDKVTVQNGLTGRWRSFFSFFSRNE